MVLYAVACNLCHGARPHWLVPSSTDRFKHLNKMERAAVTYSPVTAVWKVFCWLCLAFCGPDLSNLLPSQQIVYCRPACCRLRVCSAPSKVDVFVSDCNASDDILQLCCRVQTSNQRHLIGFNLVTRRDTLHVRHTHFTLNSDASSLKKIIPYIFPQVWDSPLQVSSELTGHFIRLLSAENLLHKELQM